MPLTLAQRFGKNATLDTSQAGNPKLVIQLRDLEDSPDGDFTNGLGLDDTSAITSANIASHVDKIFAALILLSRQNQPAANSDNTIGAFIDTFNKRFRTRNNIPQVEYTYPVNLYKNDTTTTLDPDEVVS